MATHKLIVKMRAAMLACGVAPELIDQAVTSVSEEEGLFQAPAVSRVSVSEANRFFAEKFWPNYPRRDGGNPKEPARKKLVAAIVSGENPEEILEGLRRLVQDLRRRNKVGSEFVPQAITWINGRRWKDDPPPDPSTIPPPRPNGPMGFFAAAASIGRNGER